VIGDFKSSTASSQVAARLLDVGPDGKETLVARGLWRPKPGKRPIRQVFQLHPGAWHFARGHQAKLELLPSDPGYARGSNGQRAVTVSHLQLRLPVREKPGTLDGLVGAPAPKVVPKGYQLAGEFKRFGRTRMTVLDRTLEVDGGATSIHVRCPAAWVACNRVGAGFVAKLPKHRVSVQFTGRKRIGGGSSPSLRVKLPRAVRDYLDTHDSLRVRIQVFSREQSKATSTRGKLLAP
jgi:hypothetical protein